jgi:hypothetical protein
MFLELVSAHPCYYLGGSFAFYCKSKLSSLGFYILVVKRRLEKVGFYMDLDRFGHGFVMGLEYVSCVGSFKGMCIGFVRVCNGPGRHKSFRMKTRRKERETEIVTGFDN